jgi:hypothetical protein
MEGGVPASQQWRVPIQNFYPVNETLTWPIHLSRLKSEREILDNDLANCVTYLHALRKKQARAERHLSTNPSLPRKKKKKIQQSKRALEKEIKNRELQEQATLNNLQACKANIYIAEIASPPSTILSLTIPDLASTSTRCSYLDEAESMKQSRNGWTDETINSPFRKQRNSPFFADDIAPDDYPEGESINEVNEKNFKHPPSVVQYIDDIGATLPVPPNSAQSPFRLSPEAAVFEPYVAYMGQGETLGQPLAEPHFSSSLAITTLKMMALELTQRRRATDAGIVHARRQSSLKTFVEAAGSQTWTHTRPQQSPNKDTEGGELKRSRTSSL